MACHNAIWEHSAKLLEKGLNPDRRSHEAIAAELTNHLIEGAVLTPGMVGAILELQRPGSTMRSEPNHEEDCIPPVCSAIAAGLIRSFFFLLRRS
jgi:hypothetical protein